MKYILLLSIIALSSCTENERARNFGGKETINLSAGSKLVNATWKGDDLWLLTKPMQPSEYAETYIFQEKSSYGLLEGSITIVETSQAAR